MSIKAIFDKYNDEYLKFELVEKKLSGRSDLHAFMLLDKLFPSEQPIVAAAEHDMIYLSLDEEQFESVDEQVIRELVRCGVSLSSDGFTMFV